MENILHYSMYIFPPSNSTNLLGQGLLILEASRSHSVGHLWTRDQPDAETDNTQHSQETDIHAPGGIRTHNPSNRAALDPRLRPRDHWDRLSMFCHNFKVKKTSRSLTALKFIKGDTSNTRKKTHIQTFAAVEMRSP
jgi:hypothetical protein